MQLCLESLKIIKNISAGAKKFLTTDDYFVSADFVKQIFNLLVLKQKGINEFKMLYQRDY